MNKVITILGYLTTLFLLSTIAFKVNRYPGEEMITLITGLLLSIYFPTYILEYGKTINKGKAIAVNYALAITVFFIAIGATLKLSHLELGSLFILLGIGTFCLIYAPLIFIKKSKESGTNKLMYLSGIIGLTCFPLGIFFRVYLGSNYGMQFFTLGAILISFFFLPLYLSDKSLPSDERQKRTTQTFYALIIGFLLFFCLFRSIYPPKIDNHIQPTDQQVNVEH